MNQLEKHVNQYFQESLESIKNSQRANALPFLTLEEKTLIYEYTNWEYFDVNKLLRKSKSENTPEFAVYLDKTLSKIPNYKGIVYRGVELPDTVFEAYQKAFLNKTNTDIDALPSDIQELNFIRLISKINAQIEAFEIITGKKDLESLKRAGKRFGQKTQFPIGIS